MSRQREVPQFIDIEDKIAFQLTARQLGWIALGSFFAFLAWFFLEKSFFIIIFVIIAISTIALIFVRPYGQTLPVFLKNAFTFTFKPKIYVWRKGYQRKSTETKEDLAKKDTSKANKKKVNPKKIKEAIQSLDIYE